MSNRKIYRVLIIEPSPIIQRGLQEMIEYNEMFNIVGMLSDINRIEERMATLRADVVILNPTVVGYHRRSSIRSIFSDKLLVGLVNSYVPSDLLKQFHTVIELDDNQPIIERKLKEAIDAVDDRDNSMPDVSDLTDREQEILVAVAKGMMNKEIASLHNISIHTVISHRKNISRKTGIKTASGLAVYALLNNLIEQDEIQ